MEFNTIEELLSNYAAENQTSLKGKRSERKNAWDKFYTLFAFDEIKYHKLCEENPKENRYKLRRLCYVLDAEGNKQPLGDEKYILRTKYLRNIMQKLAMHVPHAETFNQNDSIALDYPHFTLYIEKYKSEPYFWFGQSFNGQNFTTSELEIKGTWQLSLKERYLRHWLALKYVELGNNIDTACKMAQIADLKGV